jgi:hypothetical protein
VRWLRPCDLAELLEGLFNIYIFNLFFIFDMTRIHESPLMPYRDYPIEQH